MHIFWDCPQVKPYWQAVACCTRSVTSISIPMSIEVCIASGENSGHYQGNTDSSYPIIVLCKKAAYPNVEVLFDSNFGVLEGISQ